MEIIYPRDWDRTSANPEIVIYDERPARNFELALFSVKDSVFTELPDIKVTEVRSSCGFTRCFSIEGLEEPGAYAVRIIDSKFDMTLGGIGFVVQNCFNHISILPALDEIELLFVHCRNARFISNGIGKSGTTWMYRLLGTLPGVRALDMSANGMKGIDHRELERVPTSHVYHGHLRYTWENRKSLAEMNFHHVHIHRDLRDVVVSEYFHKFHMERGQHSPHLVNKEIAEMLEFDNIYKWSTAIYEANSVLDWRDSGDCVLVSYEKLLSQPDLELSRVLQALSLPYHPNLSKAIVETNSFKNVSGRSNGEVDSKSPLRKGIIGDWKNHMSTETANLILKRYDEYYRVLGYKKRMKNLS